MMMYCDGMIVVNLVMSSLVVILNYGVGVVDVDWVIDAVPSPHDLLAVVDELALFVAVVADGVTF